MDNPQPLDTVGLGFCFMLCPEGLAGHQRDVYFKPSPAVT